MSIQCMMHVWSHSTTTGNDRLILLAIADEADDGGRNAFPSMRRLASKANCNKDTVAEAIKRLEATGELEVARPEGRGPGKFNRYRVVMELSGNPVQLERGLVEGSVEGSVRTHPDNYRPRSGQLSTPIRTTEPSGARFLPPRGDCERGCINGLIEVEADEWAQCECLHESA